MPFFFALTLFVSATLLFLVQPMIAKMILPSLGGSPAVWNTCMVFFQAALLGGYAYAHWSTTWLGARKQAGFHAMLLFLPLLVLPIAVAERWIPPGGANPIPWLLALLLFSVGLPFFVVSASAPLLQKWFADSGHPSAKDPYFLYAASNLGSMLALLSYPFLLEPKLLLGEQTWIWAGGYVLLVVLTIACAVMLWRSPVPALVPVPVAQTGGKGPRGLDGLAPPEAVRAGAVHRELRPPSEPGSGGKPKGFTGTLAQPAAATKTAAALPQDASESAGVSFATRCRWVALAFVPSSLMLGVTTYLTTDIAAIPLLWVIPLALYLLSFILVFGPWPKIVHNTMVLFLPVIVLLLLFMILSGLKPQMWITIILHLATLFVAALVCHGELSRTRPSTKYLTEFYLWMSFGGVLGGLFNALLAPMAFTTVAEYPFALVLACLMLPRLDADKPAETKPILDVFAITALLLLAGGLFWIWLSKSDYTIKTEELEHIQRVFGVSGVQTLAIAAVALGALLLYIFSSRVRRLDRALDVGVAAGMGLLACGLVIALSSDKVELTSFHKRLNQALEWLSGLRGLEAPYQVSASRLKTILMYGLPALLCYTLVARPVRFGLAVGAVFLAGIWYDEFQEQLVHRDRSFFGVMAIKDIQLGDGDSYRELVHGTTLHGMQSLDPNRRRDPITYYHPTGPIGQLFAVFSGANAKKHIAVVGLGTGTLATYGEAGQQITFYEIDPTVVRLSGPEGAYFTFVRESAAKVDIVLGDARLKLAEAPNHSYGLMFLDAFSSDAIPIHLITLQALKLYLEKLTDDGIVVFHISNRYLDLEPVLGNLAENLGLVGIVQYDSDDSAVAKSTSHWVLISRRKENFGKLADDPRWKPIKPDEKVGIWTDDFSNLIKVFDWK